MTSIFLFIYTYIRKKNSIILVPKNLLLLLLLCNNLFITYNIIYYLYTILNILLCNIIFLYNVFSKKKNGSIIY